MWMFRSAVGESDRRLGCRRGGDQLRHRARRETFARRTGKASRRKRRTASGSPNSSKLWHRSNVVDPPDAPSNTVMFGTTVTVKDKKGATETFTIVGVDELDFERDAISWISPLGKALLNADMGDWITLEDGRSAKIVKIEAKFIIAGTFYPQILASLNPCN
jgi:transcription elongation GreA/GreB family factor